MIPKSSGRGISRREAIRRTLFAASGLVLAHHLSFRALRRRPQRPRQGRHPDLDVGRTAAHGHFRSQTRGRHDYCGPLKAPIETNVSGIRIGELLPMLAKQADKYTIIRSMTHGNFGHETASYIVQTGRQPGGRTVFPCVGAVVSLARATTPATRADSAVCGVDRAAGPI